MNNEMLLSIVVPVYNVEPFLEDCIRSIERIQAAKEVICIDDGSTDNSLQTLRKLANEFDDIQIIHQDNVGVSSARNKGIRLAKGKYISFFDGDDMVIAETIDRAVTLMEEKNADCLFWNHKTVPENTTFQDYFDSHVLNSSGTVCSEAFCNQTYVWKLIIKKDFLAMHSIHYIDLKYFEDQCFIMEVCSHEPKTFSISATGYLYRTRASSAMHNSDRSRFWATDAIKGAVYVKQLEEKAKNTVLKDYFSMRKQLLVLHAMTMGIMVPEFTAHKIIQTLKDNKLFPFKPMWRLLVPNGNATFVNWCRFGFFSKLYYLCFFTVLRKIKKIR